MFSRVAFNIQGLILQKDVWSTQHDLGYSCLINYTQPAMEYVEHKAITNFHQASRSWKEYEDVAFVILNIHPSRKTIVLVTGQSV